MRVGYVLQCFPQLSETFVENEIRAMDELGINVVAFSVYRPGPGTVGPTRVAEQNLHYRPRLAVLVMHSLFWVLRRPGTSGHHLLSALRMGSLTMLRGWVSAGWVATIARRQGLDHLHAHFATDSSCTGSVAAALAGLPFTFTIHAHEIYLRSNGLCERIRLADRAITVCRYNVERLMELCPKLAASDLEVIYCGVDPASFGPAPSPRADGGLRIVSVGRLVEIKGFDLLMHAVGVLRERGFDLLCEIIGEGPERGRLEELRVGLELAGIVSLPGAKSPESVANRLAASDIFVLPCRIDGDGNRDSMPVAIKEAMATGLPVVSTRTAAVPEMVDDEVGRLAPAEDPVALADAIESIIRLSPAERTALGAAGRQRVADRYNLYVETAKLKVVFESASVGRRSWLPIPASEDEPGRAGRTGPPPPVEES